MVTTVTTLLVDNQRFDSQQCQEIFHFQNIQTVSGAETASYSVGNRVLLPGVKQLGHDADHSPPLGDKF